MLFTTAVRARARACESVAREDCRAVTVGRRVGIWRWRKDELVVGFRMRERERAVLWRLVLMMLQSWGRCVAREWYVGEDSRRAASAWETDPGGRESLVVRRMISSTNASGSSAAFLGGAGCEVRVRGLAGIGGGGERSMDDSVVIRICDFAVSILAVFNACKTVLVSVKNSRWTNKATAETASRSFWAG